MHLLHTISRGVTICLIENPWILPAYIVLSSALWLNVHVSCQVVQQVQFLPLEKKLLLHLAKKLGPVDMLMCTSPRVCTFYSVYVFCLETVPLVHMIRNRQSLAFDSSTLQLAGSFLNAWFIFWHASRFSLPSLARKKMWIKRHTQEFALNKINPSLSAPATVRFLHSPFKDRGTGMKELYLQYNRQM